MNGAILAGGSASRMGGLEKGLLAVGGRRIVDRLVAAFEEALGAPPLLVANAAGAASWCPGLRVVPDRREAGGTLAGIYTAVVEAPAPVVVAAWDMPFVSAALLRELAEGLAGCDAFLPASDGPRGVEPLCAAYGPRCAPAMAAALDRGDLRAIAFHAEVRVGVLSLDRVAALGDPGRLFFNVNTADDLARANGMAS